jgi:predicted nucleic acid-binding protein
MISAVFDACVLYSGSLRDFFLRLADDGLIIPYWTETIHHEGKSTLLQNRPDLKKENLERTCREMDFHFPNALVHVTEDDVQMLQLPDLKDRHVLAAAIRAKAQYIVTHNLRDFPQSALTPHPVKAISQMTLL